MISVARALRAMHCSLRWRGVWLWLRSPGWVQVNGPMVGQWRRVYDTGWRLLINHPREVEGYWTAVAEGVTT